MIGIVDYGMGNLRSVENALNRLGLKNRISDDPAELAACGKLILPGVGSFPACMGSLEQRGLRQPLLEFVQGGKPMLGICLGMQMLFEESEEDGGARGLSLLKGRVIGMQGIDLPVPEIGWNELEFTNVPEAERISALLSGHPYAYYVHSYYAADMDPANLAAWSEYGGIQVPGIVCGPHLLGTQFHPEKSGADGLAILKYFGEEFA